MEKQDTYTLPFRWDIWTKKLLISAGTVAVSGLLAYVQQDPTYIFLVPVLEALRNLFKHRKKDFKAQLKKSK